VESPNPEFCVGVQILIARMESNPEDFDEHDYDPLKDRYIQMRRFRYVRKCLEEVFKNPNSDKWTEWRFLTAEERDALMAAFIKMERRKFDKSIIGLTLQEEVSDVSREDVEDGRIYRKSVDKAHQDLIIAKLQAEIERDQHEAKRLTMLGKQMEEWIKT
jgi:hypothetical protein